MYKTLQSQELGVSGRIPSMNGFFLNIVLNMFLGSDQLNPHRAYFPSSWNPLGPGISALDLSSLGGIPSTAWLSKGYKEGQPYAKYQACTYWLCDSRCKVQ